MNYVWHFFYFILFFYQAGRAAPITIRAQVQYYHRYATRNKLEISSKHIKKNVIKHLWCWKWRENILVYTQWDQGEKRSGLIQGRHCSSSKCQELGIITILWSILYYHVTCTVAGKWLEITYCTIAFNTAFSTLIETYQSLSNFVSERIHQYKWKY